MIARCPVLRQGSGHDEQRSRREPEQHQSFCRLERPCGNRDCWPSDCVPAPQLLFGFPFRTRIGPEARTGGAAVVVCLPVEFVVTLRERLPQRRECQTAGRLQDRQVAQRPIMCYTDRVSAQEAKRRIITTRVFRAGQQPPEDDWSGASVAERIDAVWELTRQCLEWTRSGSDEPRLQRSVSRVQRSRS